MEGEHPDHVAARQRFDALAARAIGGDLDAFADLEEAGRRYVDLVPGDRGRILKALDKISIL